MNANSEMPSFSDAPGLSLPDGFATERAALCSALRAALNPGKPCRVLEYGRGETTGVENAVAFASLGSAIAEQSSGTCTQVVFSDSARRRVPLDPAAARTREISAAQLRELDEHSIDLLLLHEVEAQNQAHPLHTFWSFLEVERLLADGALIILTGQDSSQGNRAQALREYMTNIGCEATFEGLDVVWRYSRSAKPLASILSDQGSFPALADGFRMDRPAFLRLFDQLFAPELRERAGTFRLMLAALLAKPGPYTVIETGTTRPGGDMSSNGQSTLLFDLLINTFGGQLISIDLDANNVHYARTRVSARTTVICSDSVTALWALPQVAAADLTYLDSFDFDEHDSHPSATHCLKEFAAIWGRAKPGSLLAIDDCFGAERGKHAYVARFLQHRGMRPLFIGRQTAWELKAP